LVREKLEGEAEVVRAEDWKWVEVHAEFAYGVAAGPSGSNEGSFDRRTSLPASPRKEQGMRRLVRSTH
jgi:hypothetical protein